MVTLGRESYTNILIVSFLCFDTYCDIIYAQVVPSSGNVFFNLCNNLTRSNTVTAISSGLFKQSHLLVPSGSRLYTRNPRYMPSRWSCQIITSFPIRRTQEVGRNTDRKESYAVTKTVF
jgi:hypothetical protein